MSKQNFIKKVLLIDLFCCILLISAEDPDDKYSEEAARAYLIKINNDIQVKTTESVLASWAYESNITDENLSNQLEVSAKLANFTKEIWKETIKFPWKTFKDADTRRQFQKFSVLGTAILSPEKYERFNKIISDMQSIYGKAKICNYYNRTDCNLQLEPELTEIFKESRNPDELRYYWEEWRNAAGRPVREMYKEYVDLANEAAILNNFTNNAEFWLKDYETPDFKEQVETLWEQLKPLYLQLHAYVRRRLRERYGEEHVTKRGPIPAHLLGNMWAQSWGNIVDITAPYSGKSSTDATPNMVEQGYTPLRMFKLAEQFFTSLNLSPMPDTFWKNSILEKPNDGRDLICHASAWDFYDGKDFRIKQCTRITTEDLNTVHHEMGHIQYFLQYKNQPLVYKEGTNPGFHEAVGDVMALSVSTPKHLRKIGLLNASEDDQESEINQLFAMALDKIAFLPFGYLMDQWRWRVFEGKITEQDYNCQWWQLREKYQGLSPSVVRSEADFDPGAKYHTVGSVPYIRYFVSFVIQFQFHRSLCIAAKEYDPSNPASKPLHKCDIYESKEAGALLKEMLQMGSSKPWPDAMEVMTGQRKMDARALLEYFASLQDWLEKENKRTNEYVGWESSQKVCEGEDDTEGAKAQGNVEDDNIAYSYAEFVRQDDNAFGVADYLEESEPSYLVLPHRFKINRVGTSRKKIDENNSVADRHHLKNGNGYDVKLKPERFNDGKPNEIFENNGYSQCSYCHNPSSLWPNTVFDLRTKNEEIERSKIEKALEKIRGRQHEQTFGKAKVNAKPFDEDSLNNFYVKKSEAAAEGSEILMDDAESSNEKSKNVLLSMRLEDNLSKKEFNYPHQETAEQLTNYETSNDGLKDQGNTFLETLKKYSKMNLKPNSELIRKAEAVKNQAVEVLKNCNFTNEPNDGLGSISPGQIAGLSLSYNFPVEHSLTKLNQMGRGAGISTMSRQNTQKSDKKDDFLEISPERSVLGFVEKSTNVRTPDNEYDSVSVIPTRLLRKKLQDLQDDQRNNQKKNDEAGNRYLMLVGKTLNDDGKKRLRKKSYREFSYKAKTPVVYNAIVITPSGKGDKTDDAKDQWSKISNGMTAALKRHRNLRRVKRSNGEKSAQILSEKGKIRQNNLQNRFYKSVNGYKCNIRNKLHYFGRLRFSLWQIFSSFLFINIINN